MKTALIAKFIAHELPADFVTDLAADRQAIDDAKDSTASDDNEGTASTAEAAEGNKGGWRVGKPAVGRLIKAGMREVNYLDAIVHNKYASNPDKLRAWDCASHVERQGTRKAKPAAGGTTPAPTPKP